MALLSQVTHEQDQRARTHESLEQRMTSYLRLTEPVVPVLEPEDDEEQLPEITAEMDDVIQDAYRAGGRQLVEKFSIPISGRDIETLKGEME